jgi:RecA-family ATPase/5S rRNA maturation endonuclease (ribonuclease M5)
MQVPTIQHIAAHMGGEVRNGREAVVPGPGHSAADRSLSITFNEAGDDILVHSFADDDAIVCKDYVRKKLRMDEWRPNKGRSNGHGSAQAAIDAMIKRAKAAPTPPASYLYVDAKGVVAYVVERLPPTPTNPKPFRQYRPQPGAGPIYQGVFDGVDRIPYRLPGLLEYPDATVFVTEGEKDADNVAGLGLCATTVAGGVWAKTCIERFAGRDVVILEDNDETGRKKSQKAAKALYGTAARIKICRFTELPPKGDVSDWIALDQDKHNAEALTERGEWEPAWKPGTEIPDPPDPPDPLPPLPFVDMSSWTFENVPAREWGVQDVFPLRNVALFSGEGATGKTLLALQLGVAHALGRDWIGMLPEPGPFLYFGAEDETDEIHRRLTDILCHYNVDFPDLQGNVHLLTFAGEDAVLGAPDRAGIIKPTPLFERLLAAAIEIRPIMICLDTSADVFAGNEIDRSQVRQFIGMLRKMAIAANAYVLVNSHPSLTGINTGTGLSGSTGWHNSVRARAYLTTAKTEKGEEPDPSLRTLEFKKSNYGPVSQSIALRWDQGVFKPVAGIGSLDQKATENTADRLFVALLDRFNDQGRNVSEKAASKNYAPTVFGKEDEAKTYGIKKAAFEGAMRRLFATSAISVQPYGAPSRGTTRLVTR